MTLATEAADTARTPARGGAFYRMVWKWHFLASLYVLPFMLMLSLTGGIYLYKPQIEEAIYADRLNVTPAGAVLPLEEQVAAVEAEAGITRMRGILVEDDPGRSVRIEFNDAEGVRSYAWVNPYTAEVLATAPRDAMAMQVLRKFHGELLLGDFGTKFVELAAHWAIVMFVTGAILWWPRGQRTFKDAVSPPKGTGRAWWRETHLFTGMLATVLIVPIIISGLPWTDVWGGSLSQIQERTGQASKSLRFGGNVPGSTADSGTPIGHEAVLAVAQAEGLVSPWEMRPPSDAAGAYWIRSASLDRYEQTELIVDQYTGAVNARVDFTDNPGVAQAVSLGISFHQGELYGWVNIVQNTVAALLGATLAITGFVAWWMRRPAGKLGVPEAPEGRLGTGMIVLAIGLMILFPLMGASLLVALALDWLIFRRLGWFRAA
ncbi:PepSY domain-containing protein [Pontivivens ytuae]|uniref:PepSY domain-containing protein n=2 Tax=Pontivivens ytuae TaxID=2789856 RepID=A0A7S9LSS0_9RHOB|nr:PepSY domain-containing protein [Pontivivens ytuae]